MLGLEVKTSEAAQVLLRDRLVDRGTSTDTLTVVVSDRGPPVRLRLDETEDDVLDRRRHSGHLPRDVGLEATPRLCKVLQDGLGLVLLDPLRHHVEDVVHDGGTELEVEVRVDPLLRDRLGDSLRVTPLELTREEVAEPALEKRDDTAKEEEPDTPARRPEADTGTLSDGTGVEARVDLRCKRQHTPSPAVERPEKSTYNVLQVLAHADLTHEFVLVPVHTGQLTNVSEGELETVGELEGVDVAETVLDVRVDDELRETEDLTAQVEGVSESRLLALLRRKRLDRLQVHVEVEVEVVQVLAVDEEVEHVVTLAADLKTRFDPVDRRRLEELGRLELPEQVLLDLRFRVTVVQLIEHVALELKGRGESAESKSHTRDMTARTSFWYETRTLTA